MSENESVRFHAFVKGHVQGVGFRYFALEAAQEHHLTGWVRNVRDGSVEVTAEGQLDDLNQLLVKLQNGPISAEVKQIDYNFSKARGDFDQFRVRATV